MFKKKLIDLHAEIELPRNRYFRTLEDIAEDLEREAKDLQDFLHDHRSRDNYQINIIREFESRCEFCGMKEERDTDGTPVCCQKAIDEYQLSLITTVK